MSMETKNEDGVFTFPAPEFSSIDPTERARSREFVCLHVSMCLFAYLWVLVYFYFRWYLLGMFVSVRLSLVWMYLFVCSYDCVLDCMQDMCVRLEETLVFWLTEGEEKKRKDVNHERD